MYVQKGGVKFTVVNESGKEAVVAIFGPGDFFGEGGMAGQTMRMGTATAIAPTTVLVIEKDEMIRVLHAEHELADRFIAHMLVRNCCFSVWRSIASAISRSSSCAYGRPLASHIFEYMLIVVKPGMVFTSFR